MSDTKSNTGSSTEVEERIKTKTPKQFKVLLLNDDYTTMDFVVMVLEGIFMKSPSEAVQIMLEVHNKGRGLAGIFSKQIAEAKITLTHEKARESGYPLRCILEEV